MKNTYDFKAKFIITFYDLEGKESGTIDFDQVDGLPIGSTMETIGGKSFKITAFKNIDISYTGHEKKSIELKKDIIDKTDVSYSSITTFEQEVKNQINIKLEKNNTIATSWENSFLERYIDSYEEIKEKNTALK